MDNSLLARAQAYPLRPPRPDVWTTTSLEEQRRNISQQKASLVPKKLFAGLKREVLAAGMEGDGGG